VGRSGGYVRSRRMPCQSQQHGSITPIIVVVLLLEQLRHMIVHLLVVLELGRKDSVCLGLLAKPLGLGHVDAVAGSDGEQGAGAPEHAAGVALIFVWLRVGLRGVAAALVVLAEGWSGDTGGAGGGAEGRC